jgi:hypothetical protein
VTAYRDGRYGEAASAFDALARREADRGRAAVLHANAGTAAARAERWGEASWQLRRALELAPRDPIAASNLRRLREQLGEGETEAQHFTATLRGLPLRLTLHENAWAASLAATAALLLLALWRTGRAGARTAWCATALLLAALAWWPFASSAWAREVAACGRHRAAGHRARRARHRCRGPLPPLARRRRRGRRGAPRLAADRDRGGGPRLGSCRRGATARTVVRSHEPDGTGGPGRIRPLGGDFGPARAPASSRSRAAEESSVRIPCVVLTAVLTASAAAQSVPDGLSAADWSGIRAAHDAQAARRGRGRGRLEGAQPRSGLDLAIRRERIRGDAGRGRVELGAVSVPLGP